jgi:hypothetical protein
MPYDDDDRYAIYRAALAIPGKILRSCALSAFALLLAWLGLDRAVTASGQKGAKQVTPDNSGAIQAAEQAISRWLDAMRLAEPRGYVEMQDFHELPDGARVEQNSMSWSEKFFTAAANPYHQKLSVRRSVHHATPDTFDVVRHKYDAVGKRLVVDETVNLILITVEQPLDDLLTKGEGEKRNEINKIAGLLLKMSGTMVATNLQDAPYLWVFRFPATIRKGARFSTNPEADPRRMWSWASRLDGGIHEGRLYFLCFKQRESTSGRIMSPDSQHWFDGKCWAALER